MIWFSLSDVKGTIKRKEQNNWIESQEEAKSLEKYYVYFIRFAAYEKPFNIYKYVYVKKFDRTDMRTSSEERKTIMKLY